MLKKKRIFFFFLQSGKKVAGSARPCKISSSNILKAQARLRVTFYLELKETLE